jgi:tetratricopeptide (TPR) repeat protein
MKAAALLSAPDIADTPRGRDLAGLGRELAQLLYPAITDFGFPGDSQSGSYGELLSAVRQKTVVMPAAGENDFFRLVIPALVLLDASVSVPPGGLDAMEQDLAQADKATGKSSVIPPYLLAKIAERRGTHGDALDQLRECTFRDSSFYIGQKIVAQAAMDAGNAQDAADASAKALLYLPEDNDLLLIRAHALADMGDWYQAMKFLDLVIPRAPDSAAAVLLKARLLADRAGRPEESVRLLGVAETRFPGDAAFPELRGRILLGEELTDPALAALSRALELQPGRLSTLRILLEFYARVKSWAEAMSILSRSPPADQTGSDLLTAYDVYWNLGSYGPAVDAARLLVALGYGDYPRVLLARALHARGSDPEALSLLDEGIAKPKSAGEKSRLLSMRAVILQGTGPEKALADLRQALLEDPDNTDALLAIAGLLGEAKEYHAAAGYLKHAFELLPAMTELAAEISAMERLEEEQAPPTP